MKKHVWVRFSIFALVLMALFTWAELAHAQGVPNKPQSVPGGIFYNDPYHIPLTPRNSDSWYNAGTPLTDRHDIAYAIDNSYGAKYQAVLTHLENEGSVVLLVGGYSSWGKPDAWMRPVVTYANDFLDALVLQVNYEDDFSGVYFHSFDKGVDRVTKMVLKARKAGASSVRIYGHSEGSDVTARVVAIMASPLGTFVYNWWLGQGNPSWFEGGFGFGNPRCLFINSAAAPSPEGGRRGGFYRYRGSYNGFYYGNKFVLFNRENDPATYESGIPDITHFGLAGHDYKGVFSYPEFMAEFEAVLDPSSRPANTFGGNWGEGAYVDRASGRTYDFTDVHFIPFIPIAGIDEATRRTLTVANTVPVYPLIQENAAVLVNVFNSSGGLYYNDRETLPEYGSYGFDVPSGSAIVYSSEQITAVMDYEFDAAGRYFLASYPSEAFPSTTLFIPFTAKGVKYSEDPSNNWYQNTEIIIFNPSSMNALVEATYYNTSGETVTSLVDWIGPKQRVVFSSAAIYGLSARTLASCVVRSKSYNPPIPAPAITGMVRNRVSELGSSRQYLESNYRAFSTRGASKMYAPLLLTGHAGFQSGMVVQNTGDQDVTILIRYYAQSGGQVGPVFRETLPPLTSKVLYTYSYLRSYVTDFVGSAIVEVDRNSSGNMGTIVLVAQTRSDNGVSLYEGIPDGANWYQKKPEIVNIPLIRDQKYQAGMEWDSGFNVVNMGTTQEDVQARYYYAYDVSNPSRNGQLAYTSNTRQIAGGSVMLFYYELPNFANLFTGSAKLGAITSGASDKRLGATVQTVRKTRETPNHDAVMSYSAWW